MSRVGYQKLSTLCEAAAAAAASIEIEGLARIIPEQ